MALDVLIVDGSASIRKILQRVLRQTAIAFGEFHEAGDGVEAIGILRTKRVGLILSAINMPKMDGIQFLAQVKSNAAWKSVPVVIITTEGSQARVMEAVNLGASGYILKPFTADQVRDKLIALL